MKILAAALSLSALALVSVVAWQPPGPRLVIVDRTGMVTPLGTLPLSTYAPRVSSDGRRIVYDAEGAIWIAELSGLGAPRRLAAGAYPLWSADGGQVLFVTATAPQQMMSIPAGGGTAQTIVADARAPESWSDAAQVLSYITLSGTNYDVRGYSLRDKALIPVAAQPYSEMGSRFSPDGRWLAYESFEHGTPEIYVEPWPRSGARTRLTMGGGRRPLWSADGTEIIFDRDDQQLYAMRVQTSPTVSAGPPVALPVKGFIQGGARRQYDLLPDGRFLLMFRP